MQTFQDGTGGHPEVASDSKSITRVEKRDQVQSVVYMVAFSEGLTHLATLASMYLFKDDLGLSPSALSMIFVVPAAPWFLKPFFAFLSDSYPILGMRRKPYLVIFSTFQAIGFLLLALNGTSVLSAMMSLFLISLSAAICSAVAEALMVEMATAKSDAESAVTNFTVYKAIGSALVAYFSGVLLEITTKRMVFLITSIFPLLITISALFIKEDKQLQTISAYSQLRKLMTFLQRRVIWGPALFILAFMSGPDYDDALFYFYTNVLGLKPSFMGTLRFTYGIAMLAGLLLYRFGLNRLEYRTLLCCTIILSLPIYVSPILLVSGLNVILGISDKIFVLSGGFLNEAVAEIQQLPLLVLATKTSPPGLEGSAYSAMLTVRSFGSALSKINSALSMHALGINAGSFANLIPFIWLCGIFNLVPFLFIGFIPSESQVVEMKKQDSSDEDDSNQVLLP